MSEYNTFNDILFPMLLYLLRHGDALESSTEDNERPLSSIGEDQAIWVAKTFSRFNLSLDLILSSPLRRAVQMTEIISKKLGGITWRPTEYLVPSTNERQLFRQLNDLGEQSVLLVGHEPHLRLIVSLLISGSRHTNIEMKKSTLLCLESHMPIQHESCILQWMLTAHQMKQF